MNYLNLFISFDISLPRLYILPSSYSSSSLLSSLARENKIEINFRRTLLTSFSIYFRTSSAVFELCHPYVSRMDLWSIYKWNFVQIIKITCNMIHFPFVRWYVRVLIFFLCKSLFNLLTGKKKHHEEENKLFSCDKSWRGPAFSSSFFSEKVRFCLRYSLFVFFNRYLVDYVC